MAGFHIYLVNVRPFLPVNFHRNKGLVYQGGYLGVGERFFLHYIAPVACQIPYGEQNGLVFFPGLGKGLFTPGIPVYRVCCMFQEVWTCFMYETIAGFFFVSHGSGAGRNPQEK
jgi:hypothetical protein